MSALWNLVGALPSDQPGLRSKKAHPQMGDGPAVQRLSCLSGPFSGTVTRRRCSAPVRTALPRCLLEPLGPARSALLRALPNDRPWESQHVTGQEICLREDGVGGTGAVPLRSAPGGSAPTSDRRR